MQNWVCLFISIRYLFRSPKTSIFAPSTFSLFSTLYFIKLKANFFAARPILLSFKKNIFYIHCLIQQLCVILMPETSATIDNIAFLCYNDNDHSDKFRWWWWGYSQTKFQSQTFSGVEVLLNCTPVSVSIRYFFGFLYFYISHLFIFIRSLFYLVWVELPGALLDCNFQRIQPEPVCWYPFKIVSVFHTATFLHFHSRSLWFNTCLYVWWYLSVSQFIIVLIFLWIRWWQISWEPYKTAYI